MKEEYIKLDIWFYADTFRGGILEVSKRLSEYDKDEREQILCKIIRRSLMDKGIVWVDMNKPADLLARFYQKYYGIHICGCKVVDN